MLPFVYGFTWDAGNLIFLGAFFVIVTIVGVTILRVLTRTRRSLTTERLDDLRWHETFEDLHGRATVCRHQLLGTIGYRVCDNAFACDSCPMHAVFRTKEHERHLFPSHGVHDVGGFSFPLDRYYHRGHTWVRVEPDESYLIGVDDLAKRLFHSKPALSLPAVGTRIERNGTAFVAKDNGSEYRFIAPVSGTIVDSGDSWGGWLLRVKPDAKPQTEHLLRGDEVLGWVRTEFDRLQRVLATPETGLTMADGGTPVDNFVDACPRANWDGARGMMLMDV